MNVDPTIVKNPLLKFQADDKEIQFPCVPETHYSIFDHLNDKQVKKITRFEVIEKTNLGTLSFSLQETDLTEAKKYTELFQTICVNANQSSFTNFVCTYDLPGYKWEPENPEDKKIYTNAKNYLPKYKTPYKFSCDKAVKKIDKAEKLGISFGELILTADLMNSDKKVGEIKFEATERRISPKKAIDMINWFKALNFAPK